MLFNQVPGNCQATAGRCFQEGVMLTTTVWRAVVLLLGLSTAAHAQSASVRIVALGASNTEGFGVSTWEAYPARLQELLRARGIDAEVINAGLSGDTTAGMLARLDAFLLDGTHLLILQPGGNDARYAISRCRDSRQHRQDQATARRARHQADRHRQRVVPLAARHRDAVGRHPLHAQRLRHPGRAPAAARAGRTRALGIVCCLLQRGNYLSQD